MYTRNNLSRARLGTALAAVALGLATAAATPASAAQPKAY